MDLVYIFYDVRYRSKALLSNNPVYARVLKIKVKTLEIYY